MHEKARDLADLFVKRQIGRRELMRRMGQLGVAAAGANFLLNEAATQALAADFDWQQHKGKTLTLLLNKHPYVDAMVADLDNFKQLTGLEVKYDVFPEDVYFDKVTAALSSNSSQYDAFMTGAYQTWQYGPAKWLVDMNEYIQDPAKTNPKFDWEGVLPNLRSSTAWSGVPGEALGGSGAKQWAVPWGFELNSIAYNRRLFEQAGIQGPPKNMEELSETAAKITKDVQGVYGVGVRGSRSWATIHPGFLSAYSNYGQRDFTLEGGKLQAAMNTPESKAFHAQWVKMIQNSGPKNWATYTWYQVGTDLGAGASAMIYDADILGYFMNGSGNKEAGNIAYAAIRPQPAGLGTDAECLDLVARHERLRPAEGCRLDLHPVGQRHRARPVRRPQDGLRQPGPPGGLGRSGVPAADRQVLSGLSRAVRGLGRRLEDLLHAAAAVLQPHHRVGSHPAEDGGERGPGR